ncbi:MAG: cysteine desulfurase [Myxococcota bacterium]
MSHAFDVTNAPLDLDAIRAQFPILSREVGGKPLVYLDSAASAQKPQAVIDAIANYYATDHANVHRGVHTLSQVATQAYEAGREEAARFLSAPSSREIIFVRGTTEAINLVAASYGQSFQEGDEIVVSTIEHHSNIVPWQLVAERTGARLRVIPVLDDGSIDLEAYEGLLSERTKMVSLVHVSNALGTVLPVKQMTERAHAVGAKVLLDGAQATVHGPVNVQDLGCDFYAFSGHKVYGPTGIGVLWGREALLEALPPYQGGGEMIASVSFEGSTWAELPAKFEAGTPNIAGAVGLGAALRWLDELDRDQVAASEAQVLAYGTERLRALDGLRLIGTAPQKAGVLSFVIDGVHPQDLATLLDEQGVAVRTGHHCAEPAMRRFGVTGTTRASLGVYTTSGEMDALANGIERALRILR